MSNLEPNDLEGRHWYCIRTGSKQEQRVAKQILAENLADTYCPRIKYKKGRVTGLAWVTEALFPTYVFANFSFAESWRNISSLTGVRNVVRFGGLPAILAPEIILQLKEFVEEEEPLELDQSVTPGKEVQIVTGPYRGLTAVVSRLLPAQQRVAILLEVLGMEREVEISSANVLAGKGPAFPGK